MSGRNLRKRLDRLERGRYVDSRNASDLLEKLEGWEVEMLIKLAAKRRLRIPCAPGELADEAKAIQKYFWALKSHLYWKRARGRKQLGFDLNVAMVVALKRRLWKNEGLHLDNILSFGPSPGTEPHIAEALKRHWVLVCEHAHIEPMGIDLREEATNYETGTSL